MYKRQALDVLHREPDIALVVLDVMMPHLSGFDVLAHMRQSEQWRHPPCIVLTAAGQEAQHQRALALGATEFMTKPFSPKKLYLRTAELTGVAVPSATEGDQ